MRPKFARKYIQYKQVGETWPAHAQGKINDMPARDWERFQHDQNMKKRFEFIREIDLNLVGTPSGNIRDVPIIEDPFECPICGYVGNNIKELADHKIKIHG